MPTARIDDKLELFYEDSGPLAGHYATIVLVHGAGFSGPTFRRMLPFAAANSLRLVIVNRREYPGSTPLSEAELAALKPRPDGGELDADKFREFVFERSLEMARFIAWFVKKNENEAVPVPPVSTRSDGTTTGGVMLLGWSAGIAHTLPLLAFPERIPEEVKQTLEPYMRAICLLDTPQLFMGFPKRGVLADTPRPLNNEMSQEEQTKWIFSYYTHPNLKSHDGSGLTSVPATDADADAGGPPPLMTTMSMEDLGTVLHFPAMTTLEGPMAAAPSEFFLPVTHAAVGNPPSSVWPKCSVRVVACERSIIETISGAWEMERYYDDSQKKGMTGREFTFPSLPGANHFATWDMPEETCKFLASIF